jgi:acetyl/propionyl-CoA carboxylase alpha subunit
LTAPLPGKITDIAVKAGHIDALGDTIRVIEAMKMENDELRTGSPGRSRSRGSGPATR